MRSFLVLAFLSITLGSASLAFAQNGEPHPGLGGETCFLTINSFEFEESQQLDRSFEFEWSGDVIGQPSKTHIWSVLIVIYRKTVVWGFEVWMPYGLSFTSNGILFTGASGRTTLAFGGSIFGNAPQSGQYKARLQFNVSEAETVYGDAYLTVD